MAIVVGLVYGLKERDIVGSFLSGAGDLISVSLVIAVSRGISVIMSTTGLDMYILENASKALEGTSSFLFTGLAYLVYLLLSFLIPSSSGLATVSMPIMGPLANSLGFSTDVMIMIFSAGNGLVNLFTPTSGAIMGGLALAKVEYSTWLKFGGKLFVVLGVACVIILTVAMMVIPGTA